MERTIVINHQIISLIVIREAEYCAKCPKEGQMRLLVKRNDQSTYYCQICANNLLDQLEQSQLQFTSKEIIIKELRTELTKELWADYYANKKPTCFNCLQQDIKETEYRFCGESCLVSSWIQYHGHNNLKKSNSYENLWANN